MKILAIACGVLVCGLYFVGSYALNQRDRRIKAEEQIEVMQTNIGRLESNVLELETSRQALEKAIKTDQSGFDWNYNWVDSEPIKRLRKVCRSCAAVEAD